MSILLSSLACCLARKRNLLPEEGDNLLSLLHRGQHCTHFFHYQTDWFGRQANGDWSRDVRRAWLCPVHMLGLAKQQAFLWSSPSPSAGRARNEVLKNRAAFPIAYWPSVYCSRRETTFLNPNLCFGKAGLAALAVIYGSSSFIILSCESY